VILKFTGYLMAHGGGAALLIQPTVEMAKRFSRQRLESLIENTPSLRGKVKDARSRDSHNTVLLKAFQGGTLILSGANSAVGLRSLPAKYVLCDEPDGWPLDADGEGDALSLATKRTAAFGSQKRILCVSTPTIAGFSRIEQLYQQSNQQRFFVPCSRCGLFQVLIWPNVRWDEGNPYSARYIFESCGEAIHNHEKTGMLARGEWRAAAAGDGRTSGYNINALHAPVGWLSWAELAREWI
jgi:phage terminase large subunit GpA-like protein